MLYGSIEEPVANNEGIYQRKKGETVVAFDESAGIQINRYCFVFKGDRLGSAVPILLKTLLSHIGVKAYCVLSWLKQLPARSRVASMVIEKRYEKKGWSINGRNSHYVALKEICIDDIVAWPPLDVNPRDGGIMIILGDCDEATLIGSIGAIDSEYLACWKEFVPDVDSLAKLERKKIFFIYRAADGQDNLGLVLTGNVRIDMELLGKSVSITKIFEGKSAFKVWV